jgi:capsular exopolysaccharide synthesis family protein
MSAPKQTPAIRGQKVRISPESREAEAFRVVRTGLFFGAPKGQAKTILVTSPTSGEGKSTILANLGIAIAQAGQRVLIVDADFREPAQHRIFNLDRTTKGLSSVLAGVTTLEDAIERTGMDKLSLLTCGPDVPNPAELLHHDNFARVVGDLEDQYDRILIDSPPILAVTDALILSALSDVTILVLRAEYSTRPVSMQALESLANVGAKVLGVVLNDVPRRGRRYGYYGDQAHLRSHGAKRTGSRQAPKSPSSETASDLLGEVRSRNATVNGGTCS